MTATKDILESIENRLRELNEEIATLNAARAALDGHASRPRQRPRRTSARKARPAQSKEAVTNVPAEVAAEPARPVTTEVAARTPRKSRPPTRRKSRTRGNRALDVVPAGKLELLLADTEGLTTSALAERANAKRDQVLTLLREMEAAGRVRRTGQRRGTRWHAITDEERIQARAAELAARSKSKA